MMRTNPAAAVQLAEHAIRRVERMMEHVDDSDGELFDVLERLQELHLEACLEACLEARPDPVPLARRLFKAELASGYDVFHGAVERYGEVLGETGTTEYRRLAQAEWDRLPALRPGEGDIHARIGR
jgi:hypothetical protein